jgi:alpha-glucosidase
MGWEYMLIDAGWMGGGMGGGLGGGARGGGARGAGSITSVSPSLDMEELRRFAKEKNVGLWLWLHNTSVDRNDAYKEGFPVYQQWGIAGVKIDFMDRDDQEMVNWYEKITKAAADCHLMVDFHGAFKPCGFQRTYPNQVTREGIMGNEYNRWSTNMTSEHKLTLPFTRLLSGPADYTPGGFINRQPDKFRTNVRPTQVQGTRCSELALFVVFDNGAVCNACDHPRNYRDQPGLDFLKIVPTVWDDTKVLDAAVTEHMVTARRSGNDWFLGALTNRNSRELSVKLDFLGEGKWKLRLWRDAADSDIEAEHLEVEDRQVSSADMLSVKLAPNGGYVGWLHKQ